MIVLKYLVISFLYIYSFILFIDCFVRITFSCKVVSCHFLGSLTFSANSRRSVNYLILPRFTYVGPSSYKLYSCFRWFIQLIWTTASSHSHLLFYLFNTCFSSRKRLQSQRLSEGYEILVQCKSYYDCKGINLSTLYIL